MRWAGESVLQFDFDEGANRRQVFRCLDEQPDAGLRNGYLDFGTGVSVSGMGFSAPPLETVN